MADEYFTVETSGGAFTAGDFDAALDIASEWIDGSEPVTILSSRSGRWDTSEITDLLLRRRRRR